MKEDIKELVETEEVGERWRKRRWKRGGAEVGGRGASVLLLSSCADAPAGLLCAGPSP